MIPTSILLQSGLANTSSSDAFVNSRAFTMAYPDLENLVLFVRIEEEKVLGVVEHYANDIFMLTNLPPYVKIKDIRALACESSSCDASPAKRKKLIAPRDTPILNDEDGVAIIRAGDCTFEDFWRRVDISEKVVRDTKIIVSNPSRFKKLSMAPPRSTSTVIESAAYASSTSGQAPHYNLGSSSLGSSSSSLQLPSHQRKTAYELHRHFQSLYFEALYISKSPLTFFTKLTLPRFKTLCSEDSATNHADVLRKMILSVGESDVKFKSGLPNILLEFESLYGNDEIDVIGGLPVATHASSSPAKQKLMKKGVSIEASESIRTSVIGLSSLDLEKTYIQRMWNQEEGIRKLKTRRKLIDEIKKRE